ncbi:MAG: aminotransferase class I/II-fold pyridoxal phosphate-dependent enzyme [Alphaproteobacteria bacterium]|nr:aminotransferase class I/II-fold pyridoxal phosphate-dependent enzyme [Alphaproteobacteria bacterium]
MVVSSEVSDAMALRYPYARPTVSEADIAAVTAAARDPTLTQGARLRAFETALCETFGATEAVVCNSGTAALHMLYAALGLSPERGLLTTPVTFLATANAARLCGAPVAFCDVDPVTGLMTPERLEAAFARIDFPVAVVAVVHLAGRVADLRGLTDVARRHGAVLVDDACHAPGASYEDQGLRRLVGDGAYTAASTFSFHATKHVAMGEGGAAITHDPDLAKSMRLFRNHGMRRDPADWLHPPEPDAPWYYEMHALGLNYRADELSCALGLSQLRRLPESLAKRRALAQRYGSLLAGVDGMRTPDIPADADSHAWHLYAVAVDFAGLGKTRGAVMRALGDSGVGSQVHYIPLFLQPYYRAHGSNAFPGAMQYYERTLSIPLYPDLTEEDQVYIADALRQALA